MIEQVASQRWFNDPQRLRDFFKEKSSLHLLLRTQQQGAASLVVEGQGVFSRIILRCSSLICKRFRSILYLFRFWLPMPIRPGSVTPGKVSILNQRSKIYPLR